MAPGSRARASPREEDHGPSPAADVPRAACPLRGWGAPPDGPVHRDDDRLAGGVHGALPARRHRLQRGQGLDHAGDAGGVAHPHRQGPRAQDAAGALRGHAAGAAPAGDHRRPGAREARGARGRPRRARLRAEHRDRDGANGKALPGLHARARRAASQQPNFEMVHRADQDPAHEACAGARSGAARLRRDGGRQARGQPGLQG